MCNYLTKRGATYYFRRVVPDDLRASLGRKEWTHSLGTKDRKEGEQKSRLEAVRIDALITDARERLAASASGQASAAAPPAVAQSAWHSEAEFNDFIERSEIDQLEEWAHDERGPQREAIRARLTGPRAALSEGELVLRDLLAEKQHEADLAREKLALRSLSESAAAMSPANQAPIPPGSPLAPLRPPVGGSTGVMIEVVIDKWAAERNPAGKTVDAHRAVGRWFYERVGSVPVSEITRKHVLDFKDKLLAEGTSIPNIKVKLSRLRTLLSYAYENDLATSNAAAGVRLIDTGQAKRKRLKFDISALEAIFHSPVYAADDRPTAGKGEAAYWIPLLALYTGARLEELGQLRPSDVGIETYLGADDTMLTAWALRITEDEDDGLKLKNAGSVRSVPIHPILIELGFVDFANAARDGKQARLFPKLKPDVYGRVTAKWGEWFSSYLRKTCGVSDTRMVFHSFRHSWKDYARASKIAEGVQRQIMGHSSSDVADDYGEGYSFEQLVEGMKQYRIGGFKPPKPPPGYRKNE